MAQSVQVIAVGDRVRVKNFMSMVHREDDIISIDTYDDLDANQLIVKSLTISTTSRF